MYAPFDPICPLMIVMMSNFTSSVCCNIHVCIDFKYFGEDITIRISSSLALVFLSTFRSITFASGAG